MLPLPPSIEQSAAPQSTTTTDQILSQSTTTKSTNQQRVVLSNTTFNNNKHQYRYGTTNHSGGTSSKPRPVKRIGHYELTKTLGQGSMGKVKLAIDTRTNEKRACKIMYAPECLKKSSSVHLQDENQLTHIDLEVLDQLPNIFESVHPNFVHDPKKVSKHEKKDQDKAVRLVREATMMLVLEHPNIVPLHEIYRQGHFYYFIFDYVSGGQMLDYIISHGKLKEKNARKFFRQLISAVDYCHQNHIVHRDLKIENILIDDHGDVRLIDFGLSNFYSNEQNLNTFCGSLYFAAPELLEAKPYIGPEVDIWSLGIILYVLVTGKVPFDDVNVPKLHQKIKEGSVEYPSFLSSDCKALLEKMICTNGKKRITMQEIKSHSWVMKGFGTPPEHKQKSENDQIVPVGLDNSGEFFMDPCILKQMSGFQFKNNSGKWTTDSPELCAYHLIANKMKNVKCIHHSSDLEGLTSLESFSLSNRNTLHLPDHSNTMDSSPLSSTGHDLDMIMHNKKKFMFGSDRIRAENEVVGRRRSSSFHEQRQVNSSSSYSPVPALEPELQTTETKPAQYHSLAGSTSSALIPVMEVHDKHGSFFGHSIPKLYPFRRKMSSPDYTMGVSSSAKTSPNPPKTVKKHLRSSSSQSPDMNIYSSSVPTPLFQFGKAKRGKSISRENSEEMGRADESVKTASLKGLFSVTNTSTKKPNVIRQLLMQAMDSLGITYLEHKGGFDCKYITHLMDMIQSTSPSIEKKKKSEDSSTLSRILKGANPVGRRHSVTEESMSITTATTSHTFSNSRKSSYDNVGLSSSKNHYQSHQESSSNKLSSFNSPEKTYFEIYIVKIPLMGMYGIQFRRISGDSWQYKNICTMILNASKL